MYVFDSTFHLSGRYIKLHFDKPYSSAMYNIFTTFSQAPDEDIRPLLKSKDALATFVSTLDKAGWLSMKGKSLFHVPEGLPRRPRLREASHSIDRSVFFSRPWFNRGRHT